MAHKLPRCGLGNSRPYGCKGPQSYPTTVALAVFWRIFPCGGCSVSVGFEGEDGVTLNINNGEKLFSIFYSGRVVVSLLYLRLMVNGNAALAASPLRTLGFLVINPPYNSGASSEAVRD